MEHIVIIGNGISGVTAARHIRKLSDKKITIISSETEHFFSRTALMYIYMGHMKYEHTKPYEDYFWKKNRIDLKQGFVKTVFPKQKELLFSDGDKMNYDKLIIAVGSKSNKFGWPGQDLDGVQGLYSKQDLDSLENFAPNNIPVKPLAELVGGSSSEDAGAGDFAEKEFKFCGFGGQGILSLGLVLAHAGNDTGKNVSWFPSYGPEQRGGTASCSVVLTDKDIGSPTVDKPDVLVAMNQPSLEKFAPTVKAGGVIIYDAQIPVEFDLPKNVSVYAFPAAEIATSKGVPKAANTALLGSLIALDLIGLPEDAVLTALKDSFATKPKLIPKNMEIVETAKAWIRDNR